ncbi:MAG TPA: hypothetical protein VGL72_14245 [Bryobacteraceae bacterium]|jgi:hypothetical protein
MEKDAVGQLRSTAFHFLRCSTKHRLVSKTGPTFAYARRELRVAIRRASGRIDIGAFLQLEEGKIARQLALLIFHSSALPFSKMRQS